MSCKRSYADQDPDYENDLSNDQKRLKVIEKDNKEATVRKIEHIIAAQFNHEMKLKEAEIKEIDDRLYEAIKMLEQLRLCIITSYYSFDNQGETALTKTSDCQTPIHPTVKKYLGKQPTENPAVSIPEEATTQVSVNDTTVQNSTTDKTAVNKDENLKILPSASNPSSSTSSCVNPSSDNGSRAFRFKTKKRIVVGNVSKYIPVDKREDRDQSTHKWMVYVRGPKEEPFIEMFVKKVWFFLHPSYRPNDLVEVNQPPFHLTRRGWGEFPVRVQLHFHDSRNKRVDIIHTLKLDKTYTGLQTLGSETFVDILIYKPSLDTEAVSRNSMSVTQPSIAHDIGGITIPASVKEELPKTASENISEREFSMPDKQSTSPLQTTFTDVLATNIKHEMKDHEECYNVKKCVSSFINDHGSYFSPVNVDLVKSEHSYQAEYPPLNAEKMNLGNPDEYHQMAHSVLPIKIKAEPPDEIPEWDLSFSSVANAPLGKGLWSRETAAKNAAHNYVPGPSVSNLSFEPTAVVKSESSDKILSQESPVALNAKSNNRTSPLVDSLSSSSRLTNHALKSELIFNKASTTSAIIQSVNSDLKGQSQLTPTVVNSLPGHGVVRKSELQAQAPPSLSLVSSNESSLNSAPKISIPTNSLSLQPPTIVTVQAATKKCEAQSQPSNGVATFVKCVDKRGNLFLIPLAMFLKMNPSTQSSISQTILHNSSSLLKPTLAANDSVASSSTANSHISTPVLVLSGASSANSTPPGTPRSSTPTLVSASPPLHKSNPVMPAIVAFPNTSGSQNSSPQSSLLPINFKGPQMNHTSNLSRHSLLLPQNSVSLLSGVSKLKSVLGSNSVASSSSSTKTMVSCLLKNKAAVNKTYPQSEVPKLRLNVDCFETMAQIMRYVVKNYPLVATKPDRSLHPYCATSLKDFLNWNIGKRHAAEWQRAKAAQKKVLQLVQSSSKWKSEDVWSVKQILLWCRYYGYSPMQTDLDDCKLSEGIKTVNSELFSTYTESKELLETLCEEQQKHKQTLQDSEGEEEEEIDVVAFDDRPKMKAAQSPEKPCVGSHVRLSSSPCGEFVREAVEQIGLKLMPEDLPGNIVAPLGEEVFVMAIKQFTEDILSSALANAFKKSENKKCPAEITVRDVGNAICELPHCDFLTNRFLGTKLSKHLINIANVKL